MVNHPLNLILLLLLITSFVTAGCDDNNDCIRGNGNVTTEEISGLTAFDAVVLEGIGDVFITNGQAIEVMVSGEENMIDQLEFGVESQSLIIDQRDNCLSPTEPLEIFIAMPELQRVVLAGSGNIKSDDAFESESFLAEVSGSGNISLDHTSMEATLNVGGSGNIAMAGSTVDLTVMIGGSGNILAFDYPAENCEVIVSGSGNCEVRVSQLLDVTISGSGNVLYKGNPAVSETISGSGQVIDAN